jgi:hypothetical protein
LGEGHHAHLCVPGKKRRRRLLAISTALLLAARAAAAAEAPTPVWPVVEKKPPGEPILGKIDAPSPSSSMPR